MPDTEIRTIPAFGLELRDAGADSPPVISGFGIRYNEPSLDLGGFVEYVAPGAVKKSLRSKDDIRSFYNHDASKPLGSRDAGNLVLRDSDEGLYYEVTPPLTTYAADLIAAMKAGLVKGSSFSFQVLRDKWEENDGVQKRTLLELRLLEAGPVTSPAYPSATSQVRSLLAARGINLDGERVEPPIDILALLADWQPKDEDERRAIAQMMADRMPAGTTFHIPIESLNLGEPAPKHRLALARRRFETQRKLYGI